jgi:GNAT superfamily N-acetyltransferase
VRIDDVDPHDEATLAQWFAVVEAAELHERPGEPDSFLEEQRALLLDGLPGPDGAPVGDELRQALLLRDDDGRAVAAARFELPVRDNEHSVWFRLSVHPDARRRGHGSALLAEILRRTEHAGRRTLVVDCEEPAHLAGRAPARAFADRHGFALELEEVRRDLDLPVPPARLKALEAACRPHAQGYVVRTWRDRCPDDLVDDRAVLGRQMSTDAPSGGLDWREEEWDAARVRHREALTAQQDRSYLGAAAVHAESGRMVAFTEVGVQRAEPRRVHQWETLVLPEHRGHRLGTLVKIALVRDLVRKVPEARLVSTCNATTNAPMIAVNEALGFRVNGAYLSWQRVL